MTKQEEQSEIFKKVYFPEKPKKDGEYTCGNDNFSFKLNFMKGVWMCQNPIAIAWFYEPIEPQPPLEGEVEEKPVVRESRMTELMTQEEFTDKHARTNEGRVIKNAAMMYQGYIIGFTKAKQSKPVEGDVRADAIKAVSEIFEQLVFDRNNQGQKKSTCEYVVDALLSKYNFTRK